LSDTIHRLPRVERFGERSIDGERYVSEAFLEAEVEALFRRGWIVAAPAWRVASPGDVAVCKEAGVDVIVARDEAGQLHAHHNRCMHRGSRLVDKCGRHGPLVCGYHGWRYGLDGRLESATGAEGFGGIDISRMRLKSVRVEESAGLIWVCLDDDTAPLSEHWQGIHEELLPYKLGEMKPIQETVFTIPVNWKSMLENAFDYYHVHQVHRFTIHAHVNDQPELALYGDHIRQNLHIAPYRWRRWLDARCSRGGPYTDKQRSRLYKYTLFPNTIINVLPYHFTVMRFWPDGVGRTRLHYAFCQREDSSGIEWLRAHGTWLASRVILAEDVRMLVRSQSGMDVDVVPQHLLHDYEAASAHFHATIDRWMAL
jgi:phenylpropionate dioxygenase-like ring-hydroxylating dioxygenase large terminal subunit